MRVHSVFWFLLLCCLASCNYRLGCGEAPWVGSTIAVPYVEGDTTGEVTQAIVREIASSGAFQYGQNCGCYTLCATILDRDEENIGFRYELNKNGTPSKTIIPVESRGRYLVEFSLVESCSGCVVLGPIRVAGSVEYDHEFDEGTEQLNELSVGQVSDVEAARDAVPQLVGKVLAQRIVDYLRGAW